MEQQEQQLSDKPRIESKIRRLFETVEGKEVLNHICNISGVLVASHIPGDSHETAWRDGRKSIALELLLIVRSDDPTDVNDRVRSAEEAYLGR